MPIRILAATAAVLTTAGCAPKAATPPPAPPPAPVAAPVPAAPTARVATACPSALDGPSIIVSTVEESHRAWRSNPTGPVPPACVLIAFARIPATVPDSMVAHALSLAEESSRREPSMAERIAAEMMVLARAKRHADVIRSYNKLVATDSSRATHELSRLAVSAAHQTADTASLIRALARAAKDPGANPAIAREHQVLLAVRQLWTAIEGGRGMLRQNAAYVAAYPSIITNFGTLGQADSVIAYLRRATAQRVPPATLAPTVESMVATMLRAAILYGAPKGWNQSIATATRLDSTLTTPSTKLLIAALITYYAAEEVTDLSARIGTALAAVQPTAEDRAQACRRIPPITSILDIADARLREGGNRSPVTPVAAVSAGLTQARAALADLQQRCTS